ncbi:polyphosphoinositide phosphatase isoform X2 [Aplysia californica]|uniref:Polyphosphoinositide phosphatase isoform X2 n=1 Tax=Aplysia californica TaxID=6500 RepID=A0ABM0JWQ4_APLCA|nr:polyphosphoinositide phosphatase isoform X2 [Aplysia californica]
MDEVVLISWTQKLVLYETKARYYIVGSNKSETRFRVLKIDRTEPRELVIHDDKVEYSRSEIRSVLSMIDGGNKPKKQGNNSTGLSKNISAFGIAGFVRFLEGYYMILITKRKKAAAIGPHTVYKIEDTSMLYIPNDSVRYVHPDESRYVKMFQNVDLSSNFYFSYSYDVTHTLQYNMARVFTEGKGGNACTSGNTDNISCKQPQPNHYRHRAASRLHSLWEGEAEEAFSKSSFPAAPTASATDKEMEEQTIPISEVTDIKPSPESLTLSSIPEAELKKEEVKCGVKNAPCRKFLWNNHLLQGFENCVHSDWVLYIIHGFIGQSNVCVFGKSVYLTVIGRRSNQFAGTRFLKRGTNQEGYVANEIETEQIVQDTSVTFLDQGKVSSFVQLRGSVPLFWSQDISKMVPKPPISLDQRDPYSSAAGMHFNQLLCRYGAPIIVLNLVKTRENKRHESILSEDFIKTVDYLNQFLPAEHSIQYIGFDMARVNKRKDADVMLRLNRIARYCMKQTGFFLSVPPTQAQYLLKDPELQALRGVWGSRGSRQTGLVRTNCVDCLDRTNTAQFAMGRSALAYQLYALGVLEKPHLEFDTDCVKMLEELYEDHGDTVALQYGGSQLVHRIKSYRKIAPWTSHSRDIMQTLSRYYSNAFSDVEKQQAFNLFLGVFVPVEGQPNLWDLPTDFYLHNKISLGQKSAKNHYCQWWTSEAWKSLPLPHDEVAKPEAIHAAVITAPQTDEHVNAFYEHYRPAELSAFDEMYQIYLSQCGWKHVPKNATDPSPFCVRQFYDQSLERGAESNPNISGKDSTSSTTSFGSEGSSDTSENSDGEGGVQLSDSSTDDSSEDEGRYISFKDLFPSMATVYNTEITEPSARDQKMYKRYVDIGRGKKEEEVPADGQSTESLNRPLSSSGNGDSKESMVGLSKRLPPGVDIFPISAFKLDSSFFVEPPPVSRQARDIYAAYVQRGQCGAGPVSDVDRHAYIKYINKKYL